MAGEPKPPSTESTWDDVSKPAPGLPGFGLLPREGAASDDDWDSVSRPVGASTSETVGAIAQGGAGGLLEFGPIPAGMAAGAAVGAMAPPGAQVVTVPLGAFIGGGMAWYSGRTAREALVGGIEDVRPDLRPFAVGGETFFGGLPFVGAPIAIGRTGARLAPTVVGRFVNNILDSASQGPIRFATAETSALVTAAAAGGAAEAYMPGDALVRAGAEIVGGLASPVRLIVKVGEGSAYLARRAVSTMTQSGREMAAARVLKDNLDLAGEDIGKLAALLREPSGIGADITAAQKSGSPTLAAIERVLVKESAKFGADAEKMAQNGIDAVNGLVRALRGTGDPKAVLAAAEIQKRHITMLLTARMKMAEQKAIDAAKAITKDTPRARSQLSRVAGEAVEGALDDARKVESELWEKIPRATKAQGQNILNTYIGLRQELLPEEALPAVVEGLAKRMQESGTLATTSGELLRFRSRALALARDAAGQNRFDESRILGLMAEAALDDLSAIDSPMLAGQITEARVFSRALHDTFTRTFAGRTMEKTGAGGRRIPPEVILRRAFAAGKEAGELQLRELEEATRFMTAQGLDSPSAAANVEVMLDAQERMLRLAAAEGIDTSTGLVKPARLRGFLNNNELLLERFPAVRQSVEDAIKSESARSDLVGTLTGGQKVIDQRAAFSRVVRRENPVDAITDALAGKRPVGDLQAIAKLAKRGGADAMGGLKAAAWDHVFRTADTFDPAAIRKALFEPIRQGQPSVADVMQKAGVFTGEEMANTTKLLDQAERIAGALRTGERIDELMKSGDVGDAIFDLVLRLAGAEAGGRVSGGGAPSLVAAGAGSRFMRNLFERVPMTRTRDILIEAAKDPNFMAALLEKAPTQADELRLTRDIHAYLIRAGIDLAAPESIAEMEPTPPDRSNIRGSSEETPAAATRAGAGGIPIGAQRWTL